MEIPYVADFTRRVTQEELNHHWILMVVQWSFSYTMRNKPKNDTRYFPK